MIVPDTAGGVQAAPAGLIHPVDFRIPVGPIFNFVSGKYPLSDIITLS